jgi:acyl carrier protein
MEYQTFMQKIAEITENNANDLSMDMLLDDMEGWDSLAVVTFIAMCDSEFGVSIGARDMKTAETLRDIYQLVVESGKKNPQV